MKVLITGCSWIQKMWITDSNFYYKSFGGQGLWKIYNEINSNFKDYKNIVVQLPAPVRNHPTCRSTTNRFNIFLNKIKKLGEIKATQDLLEEYKQKILDINKLHKNIVFFLYNVGGYPLRHPYDFGENADKELINFFKENNLKHLYLSFEGKAGYGLDEKEELDFKFWEYYHQEYPQDQKNKTYK